MRKRNEGKGRAASRRVAALAAVMAPLAAAPVHAEETAAEPTVLGPVRVGGDAFTIQPPAVIRAAGESAERVECLANGLLARGVR